MFEIICEPDGQISLPRGLTFQWGVQAVNNGCLFTGALYGMSGVREAGREAQEGLDGWACPEKVTLEPRLWKRGGSRPREVAGRGSSQCKGPEVHVCIGSSVEPGGGQCGCSRE